MKMFLFSGAGVSALVQIGSAEGAEYWLSKFIQKGVVPEIKIVEVAE